MLKKKISLLILLFAVALLVPLCEAAFVPNAVNVYVWVDKTQYNPGETVTLHYTVVNDRASDIVLKEIRIEFPWFMYVKDHWEGNQTLKINKVLTAKGAPYYNYTTFTIPNDGRAFIFGSSTAIFDFDATDISKEININVANPPIHSSVREMDTVILLMAVLTILIVICTALIAAAIFLSTKKPQGTYTETSASS